MRAVVVAAVLGALTACSSGGGGTPNPTPSPLATETSALPTTSPDPAPTLGESERSGCPGRPDSSPAVFDAAGGVYAAYLTDFKPVALEAAFDVIQWLGGDDAQQAYLEDTGDPDGPPNDYYIRNESNEVRTAPVSQDAAYWVVQLRIDADADVDRTDVEGFAEEWAAGHSEDVFWLTFDDGVITEICEQYRP